jgi:cation-transporting ATPase E
MKKGRFALTKQEQLKKDIESAQEILPDFTRGLSEEQVAQRKKEGLSNKVPKKVTKTYWQIFVDNFFSFFNTLLFGITAAMLSAHIYEVKFYFFLIVLVCNIVIGLITDIHARHLVDKLRIISDPKVMTIREGKMLSLPVKELVLSDIVVLSSGDQICADSVVIEGHLMVDESLITGESTPIEKKQGSEVLSGSYVRSGKAYVRVIRVGVANFAEGLQEGAKSFSRPKSELKRSTILIFGVTGGISLIIGGCMLITWLVATNFSPDMVGHGPTSYYDFMKSMSGSMVAMVPSGLYLLTSLTLATGVISLAKQHMNVQELYCIEMLARVDVICFDKTGTLTDGTLSVDELFNFSTYSDKEVKEYLASLLKATGDENNTAKALAAYCGEGHLLSDYALPFDSANKWSAASLKNEGSWILGAPSFIDGKLTDEENQVLSSLLKQGKRVVALYHNKKSLDGGTIPTKNTLVAYFSFLDHIKDDAKANIEWFKKNGVAVKVISGDDALAVSLIASKVGVPMAGKYISMEKVKDEDIPSLAHSYSVFGRVKPEQKALIISALQAEGHKVAMTGDGVNDIIALKKADCSIAMASGSSAARNVAHIVSMDNDFSKLPRVVGEGRRVINNLQRTACLFLSKTFFAIATSIFFLILSFLGKSAYPFTTSNMLVWEIVSIGGGGFFLALEPSSEPLHGSFMKNVLLGALPAGMMEFLCVFIIYSIHLSLPGYLSEEAAQTLSVIAFSSASFFVLFRVSTPLDKYRAVVNGAMLAFGGAFFLLDVFIKPSPNSPRPYASRFFDLTYNDLTWQNGLIVVGVVLGLAAIYYLIDYLFRKHITNEDNCLWRKKENANEN